MGESAFDSMPDPISDRTFDAIDDRLEHSFGALSRDFAQYETDLNTAAARATSEARQELLKAQVRNLAAFAHEVVAAAKRAGVTDEEITNGPVEDEA